MRLFLDANILFSAAYRAHSPAALLFDLAKTGDCQLATSTFALEEARRNVVAKAPRRVNVLESLIGALDVVGEAGTAQIRVASASGLSGMPLSGSPLAIPACGMWFAHGVGRVQS